MHAVLKPNTANTAGVCPRERTFSPEHIGVCVTVPSEWCQQTILSVKKTFGMVFTGSVDALLVLEA